jgi:Na+/melibiose symporter-like transporter
MSSAPTAGRLPLLRLLAFSTGAMPVWMVAIVAGIFLPKFYAGHMGISLLALGGIIATVRLADLLLDLSLGWLMDKTKTPIGRYRPWFALGLPVLWLGAYRIFNPPPGSGVGYLFGWMIVLYIAYSMLALAHQAWAARLAGNYNERSRIFGWMQAMAVFGTSAVLAAPLLSGGRIRPPEPASMSALGWIVIIVSAVVIPLALLVAPEPLAVEKQERTTLKDYLAVVTTPSMYRLILAELLLVLGPGLTGPIYLFFFHDAKGFAYGVVSLLLIPFMGAGLIGAPVWARVALRFGKPRTIQIASIFYAVAQAILMAIPAKLFWATFAGMFAVGFCSSAFLFLIQAMIADVGDEIRLNTGKERSGVLFAFATMVMKFGQSITVSVIFPILALVGYTAKDGVVNTPQAIFGLEMCYLFAPIVLVVVGALLLIGYKLTPQRHGEIRAALDAMEAKAFAGAGASLVGEAEEPPIAAE